MSGSTQRAERAGEQQERQARDQPDDDRELAVDRVDEVGALRGLAADRDAGRRRVAEAVERRAPGRGVAVLRRDEVTSESRPARRDRLAHAVDGAQARRRPRPDRRSRTSASNGESGPAPMPGRRELLEPGARGTRLGERLGARVAELDREGGGRERDEHGGGGDQRRPSGGARRAAPTRSTRGRSGRRRGRRRSSRGPTVARTTGSSVIATATLTSGINMPGDADAAQERDRQDEERQQGDRDRRAAEDDGPAGVGHRVQHGGLLGGAGRRRSSRQRITTSSA